MELGRLVLVCLTICNGLCRATDNMVFPSTFKFGVSTSAFQVEGGWNASGELLQPSYSLRFLSVELNDEDKSVSVWDHFTHIPGNIADGGNTDVTCNSYNLWSRDLEMLEELGVQMYRFSISWTRLLPNGFATNISEDGKNYYNNLIDGVIAKGIEPVVTIYHFDMPQKLQDLGGWTTDKMSDWFADYARVVFTLFGDRVKTWLTINEATMVCDYAYMNGTYMAPGVIEKQVAPFLCSKNILLAHAKAYRIYDEEFKPKYQGRVSLSNHELWFEPYTNSTEDVLYSEVMTAFVNWRYSQPIYSQEGGWPSLMVEYMANYSSQQGFSYSVLPNLTQAEIEFIRGTYDFFGMNHYTSFAVRGVYDGEQPTSCLWGAPIPAVLDTRYNWMIDSSEALATYPEGLRHLLLSLKQQYGDVEIVITENGFGSNESLAHDYDRITFIKQYLEQVLLSIVEDGVNVTGYTYWSLMDDFETEGFTTKFGLYEVNFTDPSRTRTPRLSASYYANITKNFYLD